MNAKPFLDTNILVYAFASNDRRGPRAEELVQSGAIISVQVLNEFVNVCRTKIGIGWPLIEGALGIVRDVLDPPIPLTAELHEQAVTLCRNAKLAFYDALIIAAAIRAECRVLYTEDMQHGLRIAGTTIRNPFHSRAPQSRADSGGATSSSGRRSALMPSSISTIAARIISPPPMR
jgi:predicted nucleic acid-binding protein